MRKCPACNQSYTRAFFQTATKTMHYVHAGRDCIMDQELHVTVADLRDKIEELQQQLEAERKMREQRDRQLMTIVRYATNQIYLLEITEDEEDYAGFSDLFRVAGGVVGDAQPGEPGSAEADRNESKHGLADSGAGEGGISQGQSGSGVHTDRDSAALASGDEHITLAPGAGAPERTR